jgi:hypothetical protein
VISTGLVAVLLAAAGAARQLRGPLSDPVLVGDRVPARGPALPGPANAPGDLEVAQPGKYLISVGAGLLGQCGRGQPIALGE